jgi:hypothetical protein
MSTATRRVRRLLHRLVESLPPTSGPWDLPGPSTNDLLDFRDSTDDEIEELRHLIDLPVDDPQAVLCAIEDEEALESSSDSDDEEWDGDGLFAIPGQKSLHIRAKNRSLSSSSMKSAKWRTMRLLSFIRRTSSAQRRHFVNRFSSLSSTCTRTG